MQTTSKFDIFDKITFIDGFAIILIVLYHTLTRNSDAPGAEFLLKYIRTIGLTLFIFSAGMKLGINHSQELEDKEFLKKYFVKRFFRLYKPYFGYTALIFIPVYFEMYVAKYYFNSDYIGVSRYWSSLNINGILNLILGSNFVSSHLWYLPFLIIITSVCFTLLYFFKTRGLFIFIVPLLIFDVFYWNCLSGSLLFLAIKYLPIYIFGIYYAYYKEYELWKKKQYLIAVSFVMIFLISLIRGNNPLFNYDLILYGLTFPSFFILASQHLVNIPYMNNFLSICGKYSFQIYLFHVPLLLHPINELFNIFMDTEYSFIPYYISFLTIVASIYAYKLCKKLGLNSLFE
ncbi:acyltransferase family protein [Methanosarcina sp.]|uniref:acyltransferase family protein n=1 Tax=Methanosarcina sp. TaxID=2213 RepID=UPI003BB5C859